MSIQVTKFNAIELRKMSKGDTRLFSHNIDTAQTHINQTARRGRGSVKTELIMLIRKSFETEQLILVECLKPMDDKQTGLKDN